MKMSGALTSFLNTKSSIRTRFAATEYHGIIGYNASMYLLDTYWNMQHFVNKKRM